MSEDLSREETLKELASQLRMPHDENGIRVAHSMNETNLGMITSAINSLALQAGDKVLELGPGNCAHLNQLLGKANQINYTALELSTLMQQEAMRLNQDAYVRKQASFVLYDGTNIPFDVDTFDKVMTVNTIYFWEKPLDLLMELYRVMKPGGLFSIVFAQREFMEKLPFTPFGFQLYDTGNVEVLIQQTPFKMMHIENTTERIKGNLLEMVDRTYTTFTVRK
ncbi:MAG: class I SAM-dependent methyltransferase [Cytophagales bacterium]|nr:class I SAM-dependent methyltransferase [Cytophaga sp.]